MFDLQVPFFRPLWLRIAVVVVCLGWAVFEFMSGSPGWAMLFAAAGLWSAYQFFVIWTPAKDDERNDDA